MRILVCLVQNWKFVQMISRYFAILSAIGCTKRVFRFCRFWCVAFSVELHCRFSHGVLCQSQSWPWLLLKIRNKRRRRNRDSGNYWQKNRLNRWSDLHDKNDQFFRCDVMISVMISRFFLQKRQCKIGGELYRYYVERKENTQPGETYTPISRKKKRQQAGKTNSPQPYLKYPQVAHLLRANKTIMMFRWGEGICTFVVCYGGWRQMCRRQDFFWLNSDV